MFKNFLSITDDFSLLEIVDNLSGFIFNGLVFVHFFFIDVFFSSLLELAKFGIQLFQFKLLFFSPNAFSLVNQLFFTFKLLDPDLFNIDRISLFGFFHLQDFQCVVPRAIDLVHDFTFLVD